MTTVQEARNLYDEQFKQTAQRQDELEKWCEQLQTTVTSLQSDQQELRRGVEAATTSQQQYNCENKENIGEILRQLAAISAHHGIEERPAKSPRF